MIISEVTREVDERVTVLRDKAAWCVRTVRNRLLWLVAFVQAFILSVVVFVASVIGFRKSG